MWVFFFFLPSREPFIHRYVSPSLLSDALEKATTESLGLRYSVDTVFPVHDRLLFSAYAPYRCYVGVGLRDDLSGLSPFPTRKTSCPYATFAEYAAKHLRRPLTDAAHPLLEAVLAQLTTRLRHNLRSRVHLFPELTWVRWV